MLVGIGLRVGWYAAAPCVWEDEAWTALNVIHKSFAGLLGPLDDNQAAPPAFLWAVKGCSLLFGDGTHALRLVPFVASCVGLVLLAAVGGGYPRAAVLPAVLLAAGSSKMLGHAAEVKPYTLDVCVAAAVAVWFTRTAERPLIARLRMAAVVCPVAVLTVFPGCFVAGGALLGLAVSAAGRRRVGELVWLGVAAFLTVGAFAVLMAGPGSHQSAELRAYWVRLGHFPDWSRPWAVPGWLLAGVGGVFRYDCYPLGTLFVPLAVVGFLTLRRDVAVFLAAPIGLGAVAGLVGGYPFGGSRLHAYALPGVVLLVAASVPAIWARAGRWRWAVVAVLGWTVAEGATFPLLQRGRVEYRPAAAFLRTVPLGEPVVVGDSVWAYYLRDRGDVHPAEALSGLDANVVWVAGVVDASVPDRVRGPIGHDIRRVTHVFTFGAAKVYRLERR